MKPPSINGLFVGLVRMRVLGGHMAHKRIRGAAVKHNVTGIFKPKKPGYVLIQGTRMGVLDFLGNMKVLRFDQLQLASCMLPYQRDADLDSFSLPDVRPPGVTIHGLTTVESNRDIIRALDRIGLRAWGGKVMDQTAPLSASLASSKAKGTVKYEPGFHGAEGGFLKAKGSDFPKKSAYLPEKAAPFARKDAALKRKEAASPKVKGWKGAAFKPKDQRSNVRDGEAERS